MMEGQDHSTAIWMPIDPVTASGSPQSKAVFMQGFDELARSDGPGNLRHTLTATEGEGNSTTPSSGSIGTVSPVSTRSST